MKRTELEKLKGTKIAGQLSQAGAPARFGKAVAVLQDKREQRKRDQELGLIPFAVKLHGDLIKQLHETATSREISLNDLTAELLKKGLAKK